MWHLAFADKEGNLYEHPEAFAAGRLADYYVEPSQEEMLPLPEGATLTMLPKTTPVGVNASGQVGLIKNCPGFEGELYSVGALLPQGFTRTLLPAYSKTDEQLLPLFGYAAVGFKDGKPYVAAVATDAPAKWNPLNYNTDDLAHKVNRLQKRFPENRILKQLGRCSLSYGCLTAQNMFYHRWEAGVPVSPVCNANCLGCISLQESECCPSPQQRIDFVPTVEEIVDLGVHHLQGAKEAIISFGQGCEGEPSLSYRQISQAITKIRATVQSGTININTNAGNTEAIRAIVDAGLNSMRVSCISPTPAIYEAYYRPRNYGLEDVKNSILYAKSKGVYVSINLLAFPGITDSEGEVAAWLDFIKATGVDLIQFRNLNIDPDWFLQQIPKPEGEVLGVPGMLEAFRQQLPGVELGNFSRPIF